MRRTAVVVIALFVMSLPVRAGDDAATRDLLEQAIRAHGGEAALAKIVGSTMKMKGTIHVQNMALEFTGEVSTQGADQQRAAVELAIGGQKVTVISVLNRDKGWIKIADNTTALDKDRLVEAQEAAHAGSLGRLLPLRDKAYKLALLGEIEVDNQPALGVRVSREGRRDVNLYFDKKTHRLVKTEARVKDEATGQEMTQEAFLGNYDDKSIALKITVKRDGNPHVQAEIHDFKAFDKLDDSVFDKP